MDLDKARALCILVALTGMTSAETFGPCQVVGSVHDVEDKAMMLCDRTGRFISAGTICRTLLRKSLGQSSNARLIFDLGAPDKKPEWHFPEVCLPGTISNRTGDPWKCHCTSNHVWDCFQSEDHYSPRHFDPVPLWQLVTDMDSARTVGGRQDHNSTSPDHVRHFWYCDDHGYRHSYMDCFFDKERERAAREMKRGPTGLIIKECLPGTFGMVLGSTGSSQSV